MENIICAGATVTVFVMLLILTLNKHKSHVCSAIRSRMAFWLLLSVLPVFMTSVLSDTDVFVLPMLTLTIWGLTVLSSSLWEYGHAAILAKCLIALFIGAAAYCLLFILGFVSLPSPCTCAVISLSAAALSALSCLAGHSARIYDIKALMKTSNVWSYVCHTVEHIYVTVPLVILPIYMTSSMLTGDFMGWPMYVTTILLLLETSALVMRVSNDTSFVIMSRHERTILESMKVSSMEMSSADSQSEGVYKELYGRILSLFEETRPFLDSDLTINDVALSVYSNRFYVSKAICSQTGRNFCQFVNYHRIMHSIALFRERPELKVSELANMSGFNTLVSFSSAFRLFMHMTPSEWCRKERNRMYRKKK